MAEPRYRSVCPARANTRTHRAADSRPASSPSKPRTSLSAYMATTRPTCGSESSRPDCVTGQSAAAFPAFMAATAMARASSVLLPRRLALEYAVDGDSRGYSSPPMHVTAGAVFRPLSAAQASVPYLQHVGVPYAPVRGRPERRRRCGRHKQRANRRLREAPCGFRVGSVLTTDYSLRHERHDESGTR
jgi:hypothetical protein